MQTNIETEAPILVVDNDDHMLLALTRELKEMGYDPLATWSGLEALHQLKSRRFGILLVDSYLPDMYIGDFLERVSDLPLIPKIWVMQTAPAQDVCIYGSRSFQVVDKRKAAQVVKTLHAS
jgi:CheY-like chemotaxis protein